MNVVVLLRVNVLFLVIVIMMIVSEVLPAVTVVPAVVVALPKKSILTAADLEPLLLVKKMAMLGKIGFLKSSSAFPLVSLKVTR
jgi:hypothetical protein